MPRPPIIEFADLPQTVVHDIEAIRHYNPQRFEMEQLTAVTRVDTDEMLIVGYKDVAKDEFWARGHIPGTPVMPGVMMTEAAAQLGAFFCRHGGYMNGAKFIGLGGMDEVRFRGVVRPGDRLWIVGKVIRASKRIATFEFQGLVDGRLVFEAKILGLPLSPDEDGSSN